MGHETATGHEASGNVRRGHDEAVDDLVVAVLGLLVCAKHEEEDENEGSDNF